MQHSDQDRFSKALVIILEARRSPSNIFSWPTLVKFVDAVAK